LSEGAARVVAHAKINLTLRVLAREDGGFHTIETVFARIALGDLVTVRSVASGRSLECSGADTGPLERNLAYRAALAFADATGWPSGFAITLEKRIPVGGGLGGGSADAGAVLRALAALSPRPVPEHELLRIAASLGSDVPFLATNAPLALAWGRGERMLALPSLPERDVALVNPGFAVSTAEAYSWLAADAAERGGHPPVPRLLSLADFASWDAIVPITENDFEPAIARRHPEITRTIAALRASGAAIARMSGSGSTLYGIFASRPDPAALSHAISGEVVMTHTLAALSPVEPIA
jgi:4-diphosphocytidyl-2-C-methyl-D-erythritol kinase